MEHPPSHINKIIIKTPKCPKYTKRKPLGEGCHVYISSKVGNVLQSVGLMKRKWPPKAPLNAALRPSAFYASTNHHEGILKGKDYPFKCPHWSISDPQVITK